MYCVNANPILLQGNHAPFGEFSGPGITDHFNGTATFDPTWQVSAHTKLPIHTPTPMVAPIARRKP